MKKKGFWSSWFGGDDKAGSANAAADRLKVIVASAPRLGARLTPARLDAMKLEILDVVKKYVTGVDVGDVDLKHRHESDVDMLEMNINLPEHIKPISPNKVSS